MTTELTEPHAGRDPCTRNLLRIATCVFAAALLLGLIPVALLLPASGRGALPEWLLFIGRFHPLVLHLPIGLLVLLPVFHLLAWRYPSGTLRPAIVAILWLCAGSAFAAAICGGLLSQEGGYAGDTLVLHRQLALGLTGLVPLLLVCESESAGGSDFARRTYRAVLPLTLLCLGCAAHLGASLTHGSTFLTEHLPHPLKTRMGLTPQGSAYTELVAPIFTIHCTTCHGPEKRKGGLRLDSLDAILAGGDSQRDEHKPAVIPSHSADSLLIRALCLPADDDAHMPPEGKPPLTPAEIATLRWWIDAGADAQTPASKAPTSRMASDSVPKPARL